MTKTIRIEDADYDTIMRNADGRSAADEVHRMLTDVTNVTSFPNVTNVTELKEMIELIKALNIRMDSFMTHGQGAIRVYPEPVQGKVLDLEGADSGTYGFRRASVREEK
jgi:hypothetical protein